MSNSPYRHLPLVAALLAGHASFAAAKPQPLAKICREHVALVATYLRCEDEVMASRLSSADIASCSETYDTLKRQAFSGEFERIRAWYERVRAEYRDTDAYLVSLTPSVCL